MCPQSLGPPTRVFGGIGQVRSIDDGFVVVVVVLSLCCGCGVVVVWLWCCSAVISVVVKLWFSCSCGCGVICVVVKLWLCCGSTVWFNCGSKLCFQSPVTRPQHQNQHRWVVGQSGRVASWPGRRVGTNLVVAPRDGVGGPRLPHARAG